MEFSDDNEIVALCVKGMEFEGQGKLSEASDLFTKAWNAATNDFEKFTAAHYVARHKNSVSDKLKWDKTALHHALNIDDVSIKASLPSLYLNIAKCYEDLNDFEEAKNNYQKACSFSDLLAENEYGDMIKKGIANGLKRTK